MWRAFNSHVKVSLLILTADLIKILPKKQDKYEEGKFKAFKTLAILTSNHFVLSSTGYL